MKLGILTFHSQLNYGGVLQCLALKSAIERMGHHVVVLDKWMRRDNGTLLGIMAEKTVRKWLAFMARALLGLGDWGLFLRVVHTIRFVRSRLRLTPYHFFSWADVQVPLGVDRLVIGSDQVWSSKFQDPSVFLLNGAPDVNAIAYAASFGMHAIPNELFESYQAGMRRFRAISVRETEGASLVEELGRDAKCVCDPTLLLSKEDWCSELSFVQRKRRRLCCYFLGEDVDACLPELAAFADVQNCGVEIFHSEFYVRRFPRKFHEYVKNWKRVIFCLRHGIRIRTSASPVEFVKKIANSTWVLTDSFHAVMFSVIFKCDIRFLRPHSEFRKGMISRIEDFKQRYVEGPFWAEKVEAALESFAKGNSNRYNLMQLEDFVVESKKWLRDQLGGEEESCSR